MRGAGSEFVASILMDMCKDLGVTFLFPATEGILLFGNDKPLVFFVEDRDVYNVLEVGTVLETFGVEIWGEVATGDAGFFFVLAISLILLIGEV